MRQFRILCWNVNGVRSIYKKGFLEWLENESPDVLCIQETKAHPDQLPAELVRPRGYRSCWNSSEVKGYSGVATFSKEEPVSAALELGVSALDREGRIAITEYAGFRLYNVYFPNGKQSAERLKYKLDFYDAFLDHLDSLKERNLSVVVCGDYNTAHNEIDLARPRENEKVSGFLPVERQWMDRLVAHGYVDTFRHFHKDPHHYTWWDVKSRARERNVGWRIDYFFVSENLLPAVSEAFIMTGVTGSDHCPVGVVLSLP